MKSATMRAFTLFSLLLASAVLLNGCAVFGRSEPGRMVATLQSVQDDYSEAALDAKATEEALDELVVSEVADLEQAYRVFALRVSKMQTTGDRLITHGDEMHFSGPSYLVESNQSPTACLYPRQRLPEDTKAAELGRYFYAIADEGWEVKRTFRAYQSGLIRLRDVLSTNLAPITVVAMSPIIRKAKVDSDSLTAALNRALSAIQKAKAATAQAAPTGG